MGMFAAGKWSEPHEDGNVVTVHADMQPDMPAKAVDISFTFNDAGLIQHIETRQERGTPPPPSELKLTDEIKRLVNNSLEDDCPMVVGYMAEDGQPQLSLRGSMRAISDTQLAFWVRNPSGGPGMSACSPSFSGLPSRAGAAGRVFSRTSRRGTIFLAGS